MSESMIERCAREAYEAIKSNRVGTTDGDVNPLHYPPWDELPHWYQRQRLEFARAVFAAARELTDEIVIAGLVPTVQDPTLIDGDARIFVRKIYGAMIDAILTEKP